MRAESIEQIESLRSQAYRRLEPLDDGYDYEEGFEAYERAFDLLDQALAIAMAVIKESTHASH